MLQANSVEEYLEGAKWESELRVLREVLLSTELVECVKWGAPHYTLNKKNVVGIVSFKEHFALWFHQGVFLRDPLEVLTNASEGVTKGLRQWRFSSMAAIDKERVKEYLLEAIDNQRRGLEIKPEAKQVAMPTELDEALKADSKLKEGFDRLTPGKRKEYAEYIGAAKQEKTRVSRLEKSVPMILAGQGVNDKYR